MAYVDVLVNAGIIDSETENFCINKVKQLLDELLKEGNKTQTITATPLYRDLNSTITNVYDSTGSHPNLPLLQLPVICKGENYGVYQPL